MKNKVLLYFLFFLFFLFFVNVPLFSQAKKEKLMKIGVVDLQKVFEKSPGKKIAEEALEKERKNFEKEKIKREKEIEKMKEEYNKKKGSLSATEREKEELNIQKKVLDLKKFIEDANAKLEKKESELLEPLLEDIKDVIRAVSIKYAYDIILDKSTYVLYVDKQFDITDEVIKELEGKYK